MPYNHIKIVIVKYVSTTVARSVRSPVANSYYSRFIGEEVPPLAFSLLPSFGNKLTLFICAQYNFSDRLSEKLVLERCSE